MPLVSLIARAQTQAKLFLACEITAIRFEERLLELGFYNVEFNPPAAALDGVRYNLGEAK